MMMWDFEWRSRRTGYLPLWKMWPHFESCSGRLWAEWGSKWNLHPEKLWPRSSCQFFHIPQAKQRVYKLSDFGGRGRNSWNWFPFHFFVKFQCYPLEHMARKGHSCACLLVSACLHRVWTCCPLNNTELLFNTCYVSVPLGQAHSSFIEPVFATVFARGCWLPILWLEKREAKWGNRSHVTLLALVAKYVPFEMSSFFSQRGSTSRYFIHEQSANVHL